MGVLEKSWIFFVTKSLGTLYRSRLFLFILVDFVKYIV